MAEPTDPGPLPRGIRVDADGVLAPAGDRAAADDDERTGHTLSATALVHEAHLRLEKAREIPDGRGPAFVFAAAEAMRRILIEHGRALPEFVVGDLYADCNASGNLTVADFGCFQTKFVVGCP